MEGLRTDLADRIVGTRLDKTPAHALAFPVAQKADEPRSSGCG